MEKAGPPSLPPPRWFNWLHSLGRALRDRRAASAAEYALMLSIVGAVIAIGALSIGDLVGNKMDAATQQIAEGASVDVPADIRPGQAAFIKPDEMNTGNWYPVEFVAGPTIEALKMETESLPTTKPSPIYVGENMLVRLLKDPNFEIRAKSPALQQTGPDLTATWQWDVKPGRVGSHTLIAQIDLLKRRPDGGYDVYNRYSRRVSVRVSVTDMQGLLEAIRNAESVGDALTLLFWSLRGALVALTALVVAAFGLRWALRKYRRRAPRPEELKVPTKSDGEVAPSNTPPESPK